MVCKRPDAFRSFCVRSALGNPVEALQRLFYGFKVLQVLVFVSWCWSFGASTGWPRNWGTPVGWLAMTAIGLGQGLNVAAFLRLGRLGVFYGDQLGHRVAWRAGFPYSLFDHPQYVGAALSIWGLFLLARYPFGDWIALPLLQSSYYALGAWLERAPAAPSERG